jgi:hypothetical protein
MSFQQIIHMKYMMGPGANAACSWGNEGVWDTAALALPGHVTDNHWVKSTLMCFLFFNLAL